MGIISFILFLIVASVCAFLAERLVPNSVPGGFLTSAIVGIIGAWVGGSLIGHFGPDLAGVALVLAFWLSILVFLLSLCSRGFRGRHA